MLAILSSILGIQIVYVSCFTLRMILTLKGEKYTAAAISMIEENDWFWKYWHEEKMKSFYTPAFATWIRKRLLLRLNQRACMVASG